MEGKVNRRWAWARAALLSSCLGLTMVTGAFAADDMAININDASAQTLAQGLHGVGEVTARRIVAYREANGPFQRIEDLLLVRGIGAGLLERNRSRLAISASAGEGEQVPKSVMKTD